MQKGPISTLLGGALKVPLGICCCTHMFYYYNRDIFGLSQCSDVGDTSETQPILVRNYFTSLNQRKARVSDTGAITEFIWCEYLLYLSNNNEVTNTSYFRKCK